MTQHHPYLRVGSARDLPPGTERVTYRALEMIPGLLVWATFGAIVGTSLYAPVWAVMFTLAFDFYWLLKTVYFSWHLRASFRTMREYMKIDWEEKLDELDLSRHPLGIRDWRSDLWHLVILPYYEEGYEVLETTCRGILATQYPKQKLLVVLSGEARAGEEARRIGERISEAFGREFGKFLFTIHKDQPGELAGKGANETWAARFAKTRLVDAIGIPYERVLVSVFDADTVPFPQYFGRLAYSYLTAENPLRTSFQPVPLFINNIWEAPAIARLIAFSSTFWHLMNQMRPERLVSFSSHAFPFAALAQMGFWQTNVVSEDSRIFWQGLLTFDGDWRVAPLLIPVSMDANVAESFSQTLKALYLQQRRWAYGSADIPYFLFGFLHNKKIPLRTKLYWGFNLTESFWGWATNSLIIFFMGWLPLFLGGKAFGTTVLAHNVPTIVNFVLNFAMLGVITSVYLTLRILPPLPLTYGRHRYLLMVLQWFLIPVSLIFSSLPAIDAQTRLLLGKYMGFWHTQKVRKGIQKDIFTRTVHP